MELDSSVFFAFMCLPIAQSSVQILYYTTSGWHWHLYPEFTLLALGSSVEILELKNYLIFEFLYDETSFPALYQL